MHRSLDSVALVLAFIVQAHAEGLIYTSGITGSSQPIITPAPQAGPQIDAVAGPLTISVTNSFGEKSLLPQAHFQHWLTNTQWPLRLFWPQQWCSRRNQRSHQWAHRLLIPGCLSSQLGRTYRYRGRQ